MNDEFVVLKVGTIIEFPGKSRLTITGIEVHKFIGEWETQVTVDWKSLETGEEKPNRPLRMINLVNTLSEKEWWIGEVGGTELQRMR